MIRRALDKAFRAGLLPYERTGITPLEECEAIARAIYAAAAKQALGPTSSSLHPDDPADAGH